MTFPPKETLYKTAYSPMYERYTKIKGAFQNQLGNWIFICEFNNDEQTECWFSKEELTNFCL